MKPESCTIVLRKTSIKTDTLFVVDNTIRIKPKKILMKLIVKKVKIFSIGSTLQI
jgi:hypothetical protein